MAAAEQSTPLNVKLTIGICFLIALLEGYDLQVLSVAGPLIREAMTLQPKQMGVAFSASLIGLAIGALASGYISDRIGRKPVLFVSVILLGLFTLGTAFTTDYTTLLIARILTGVAIGGVMPNIIAAVAAVARSGRSTASVTLMICGIPTGGIVAALASNLIAQPFGWQGMFVFGGVLTLLVAPIVYFWLPDVKPAEHKQSQLSYGRVLFGEGRLPITLLLWIMVILSLAVVSLMTGWLPTLVVDKGLPASAGRTTMLWWNVGGICGALLMGRLCDTWGIRNTLLLIFLGMAAACFLFTKGATVATVMPLAALLNVFVGGSHYTIYGFCARFYPVESYGSGVGAILAAGRIGSVLGPIIAGNYMHAGSTVDQVVLALVPVALTCAACTLALSAIAGDQLRRKPKAAPDPIAAEAP